MLILPLFILFVLLLIDFGVLMYGYVSVANAAREGARFASVNCGDGGCTESEVDTQTIARSGGFLSDPADVTVVWIEDPDDLQSRRVGDPVAVRASRMHEFLFIPSNIAG